MDRCRIQCRVQQSNSQALKWLLSRIRPKNCIRVTRASVHNFLRNGAFCVYTQLNVQCFRIRSDHVEILYMDGQRTILSEYPKKKIRKNNVESSIEPPTAESCFCVSGRFFHSGSHIIARKEKDYNAFTCLCSFLILFYLFIFFFFWRQGCSEVLWSDPSSFVCSFLCV